MDQGSTVGRTAGGVDDARQRVAALQAGVSDLATMLFELESDPAAKQLEDNAAATGATLTATASGAAAARQLWGAFPGLREAVERLVEARDRGQATELEQGLLAPVPDGAGGSAPPEALLATLRDLATTVSEAVDALRRVWDVVVPGVTDARSLVGGLEEQAAGLGLSDAAALVAARRAVDDAQAQLTTDPMGVDLAGLVARVEEARTAVQAARASRAAVADRLAEGERLIARLARLIERATTGLELAREKIAHPTGLLEPPPGGVIDGDDRALQPWLERIRTAHATGQWRAAAAGLDRWEPVARGHLDNARHAAVANAAPVEQRNELRGLLDALRSKAAARGLVEDPTLSRLHDEARAVLYIAPCPLPVARERVDAYREALASAGRAGPEADDEALATDEDPWGVDAMTGSGGLGSGLAARPGTDEDALDEGEAP